MCPSYPCCHPSTRLVKLHSATILTTIIISFHYNYAYQPTTATPASRSKPETFPGYPVYIGLYDYSARTADDLSFMKGNLMYIINDHDDDWWFACMKDSGKEGYIPSNYVTEYNMPSEE